MVHNSDMLPEAAAPDDDRLEQDAPDHPADDPAVVSWFLADGDRANRATDLRMFTTGNLVEPLIDGRNYFARLRRELMAVQAKDEVYFLDSAAIWMSASRAPGQRSVRCSARPRAEAPESSGCCGARILRH
jgi:hypothetical protein